MKNTDPKPPVREQVSEAYTRAVRGAEDPESGGGSCCEPAGFAVKLAGYDEQLAEVPAAAARASFGCGNPLAFSEVLPGQTVLDLGAGAGLDLILAARKVGPEGKVIGVDMTDAMIESARRNLAEAGARQAEVRKGFIEDLPVDDDSVDWVISNCVINLSPDKPAVFREIQRVLRPGGRFSISDIVVEELPDELREIPEIWSSCVGGAISEGEYRAGLEAAGLSDVAVSERLVYDAEQIRGIVSSDLEAFDLSMDTVTRYLDAAAGKVWSARFTGGKPA